jgi:hypothetical protein
MTIAVVITDMGEQNEADVLDAMLRFLRSLGVEATVNGLST